MSVFKVFFFNSRFAIDVSKIEVSASILPCEAVIFCETSPWTTPAAFAITAFSLPFCQFLIAKSIPPVITAVIAAPTAPKGAPTPVAVAAPLATSPAVRATLTPDATLPRTPAPLAPVIAISCAIKPLPATMLAAWLPALAPSARPPTVPPAICKPSPTVLIPFCCLATLLRFSIAACATFSPVVTNSSCTCSGLSKTFFPLGPRSCISRPLTLTSSLASFKSLVSAIAIDCACSEFKTPWDTAVPSWLTSELTAAPSPRSTIALLNDFLRFLPNSLLDIMLAPKSILTGERSVFLPALFAAAVWVTETLLVIFPSSSRFLVVMLIASACFCPSIIFFLIVAACILNIIVRPTAVAPSNLSGLLSIGKTIVSIDSIMIASILFATPLSGFFWEYIWAAIGIPIPSICAGIIFCVKFILFIWRALVRSAAVAALVVPSSFVTVEDTFPYPDKNPRNPRVLSFPSASVVPSTAFSVPVKDPVRRDPAFLTPSIAFPAILVSLPAFVASAAKFLTALISLSLTTEVIAFLNLVFVGVGSLIGSPQESIPGVGVGPEYFPPGFSDAG